MVLAGENGELRYYIVAGDSEAQFSIDEELGVVTVAKSLDRETRSRYDVTIQAVDQAVDPAYRLTSSVVVSCRHHSLAIVAFKRSAQVQYKYNFNTRKNSCIAVVL